MSSAGWLLVGIAFGVLLTVALIEWWSHHNRRMAQRRTRTGDRPWPPVPGVDDP